MGRGLFAATAAVAVLMTLGAVLYSCGVVQRETGARYPMRSVEHRSQLSQDLLAFDAAAVAEGAAGHIAVPQRNLFQPVGPQQPEDQSLAAPEAPPPAAAWVFKGRVTIGAREAAVLENRASGETWFVGVGESVGEFRLLDMNDERVVLSKGSGDQVILELIP